ncbi:Na+/H+ antiporter NhaA [Frankia sp. CNm7]|uniref:Na(+)/H(+) antiporter NhaA n=1 Tax=Frankia nepalensis TaxID=1836974 RepID=A0A937RQF8_9ACTN|nr:Na+/H+ antiporter NhaA [Frankia nepalensis]MBL7498950.1 Na+/H+ antiporter NhaA [Frankia nepalensis]MBL7511253.1 Na+/H+ antiporter NhaA [Frankia nepalensis]MBL7520573.1 Na+/H+ antiporter NhaA [Frankia nepalensis]MBL7630773.1 Na+/H+ antiporter NhaA [Frankia nepalensis]
MSRTPPALFGRLSWPETRRIAAILRKETIGGALLLVATAVALCWANSPWSRSYQSMLDYQVGPAWLHLDLTLAEWAADGLLAVFFFVAGLELKREFVAGDLRDPRRAAVPVVAAAGGVAVPAVLYTLINLGGDAARGWAIPTATDIAFALAVLAVIGRHLPTALRTFLLTLAVVDDLIAIAIIAVGYTHHLAVLPALGALVPLALFAVLVHHRVRSWWLLLPLAAATWGLIHASGIHATVAGVLLGLVVPVRRGERAGGPEAGPGLAEHFEHRWRPVSAGLAVPIFAFFSAGVTLGGLDGLADAFGDRAAVGVIVGLVIGKPLGIMAASYLVARFTRATLADGLAWIDVLGLAVLAGIGFTVSLLIGELAFGSGSERYDHVQIAILASSLLATLLAMVPLRLRNRAYRRIHQRETAERGHGTAQDFNQVQATSATG